MARIKILDRDIPLKLEWLRSFLAVAEQGGFSQAARVLYLSQPAVWTQLRELEANLGVKLLEHVGGKTQLTQVGQIAAREARQLLSGVRDFRELVAGWDDRVQGVLALGASTTPGNYLLLAHMRRFELRHPGAQTTLSIGNSAQILDRLRANEVDLGVVGIKPSGTEFVSRPLCEDEIALFVGSEHPLAGKRRVSRATLAKERWIVREHDSATRRLTDRLLAGAKAPPVQMELGCPETVKRVVAAGLGVGVLSKFAIEREIRHGELVLLAAPGFPIRRTLYVTHAKRKHLSRLLRDFLQMLRPGRE